MPRFEDLIELDEEDFKETKMLISMESREEILSQIQNTLNSLDRQQILAVSDLQNDDLFEVDESDYKDVSVANNSIESFRSFLKNYDKHLEKSRKKYMEILSRHG